MKTLLHLLIKKALEKWIVKNAILKKKSNQRGEKNRHWRGY